MNDLINKKTILYNVCLVALLLLAQACGSKSEQAPSGSTVKFTTGDQSFNGISAPTCVNNQILVSYSDGTPMPHARVTIYGAFAFPRNSALINPRYQFYAIPGCDTAVGNFPVNSPFELEADDRGVYTFSALITDPTVTFSDTIYAYSGSAVGTAKIEVK